MSIRPEPARYSSGAAWRDCAVSRLEGMEGRARSGDVRLHKHFPQEQFDPGTLDGHRN